MTQPSEQAGSWLSGVDFAIQPPGADWTNPFGTPAGGGGASGGGYALSPTAAGDMLGQAQDALAELQKAQRQAGLLKQVQPPAKDPASSAYNARLVNGSGAFDFGVSHVDTEIAYLNELIDKIKEAFKKLTGHEPVAADAVTQAGAPLESPGQSGSSHGGIAG